MDKQLDKKLKKLGEKLKKTKPGTKAYDKLMLELDQLMGIEHSPDPEEHEYDP